MGNPEKFAERAYVERARQAELNKRLEGIRGEIAILEEKRESLSFNIEETKKIERKLEGLPREGWRDEYLQELLEGDVEEAKEWVRIADRLRELYRSRDEVGREIESLNHSFGEKALGIIAEDAASEDRLRGAKRPLGPN